MSDIEDVLEKSKLKEAGNALNQVRAGAQVELETQSKATAGALIATYRERHVHLAGFSSHHAQRLTAATVEFCEGLELLTDDESISYARVDDSLLGSYIVWYLTTRSELVGCLYVIGKSEVADDVWDELWLKELE
ncbi:MAG: hypothetical protein ACI9ON_003079 [Limisphaerales bacterium]|jgi:hypothetical protein